MPLSRSSKDDNQSPGIRKRVNIPIRQKADETYEVDTYRQSNRRVEMPIRQKADKTYEMDTYRASMHRPILRLKKPLMEAKVKKGSKAPPPKAYKMGPKERAEAAAKQVPKVDMRVDHAILKSGKKFE